MREMAEFDVADFDDPNVNRGVYARFYYVPKEDTVASAEAGRPIFKEVEYIEIIAAGNANNIIRKPAREDDRRRFHKQYAMFRQGDSDQMVGTPLTEVPWISRGQAEELMYHKIRTLENLAEANDNACAGVPGMYDLRRRAKAWLEKAAEAAPFTKMQEEMDEMRKKIASLEAEKAAQAAPKVTPAPNKG